MTMRLREIAVTYFSSERTVHPLNDPSVEGSLIHVLFPILSNALFNSGLLWTSSMCMSRTSPHPSSLFDYECGQEHQFLEKIKFDEFVVISINKCIRYGGGDRVFSNSCTNQTTLPTSVSHRVRH